MSYSNSNSNGTADHPLEIPAPSDLLALVPIQPYPLYTMVAEKRVGFCLVSAISRRWEDGASARCRLCPAGQCTAFRDSCLILTTRDVGDGMDAALFRAN